MGLDDQAQIDSLVVDLTKEFGDRVGPERVRAEVMRIYGRFSTSPIRQYVPVLTRRIAREELLKGL